MAVSNGSRAVLVTGASRGLGRAIALHAASAGFRVWAGIRDETAGSELVSTAHNRDLDVRPVILDVTDKESIKKACDQIARTDGTLYGVVNNAGVTGRSFFEDYPEEHIRKVFEVNLFGPMNVIRCALPLLRANGGGRIVNISSIGGRIGSNSVAPYVASKFGLEGLRQYPRQNLRVHPVVDQDSAVDDALDHGNPHGKPLPKPSGEGLAITPTAIRLAD